MHLRNLHRLGKRDYKPNSKPRNVIVAFTHQPDVDGILQLAKDKQDPRVQIRTDLPKVYNDIRNALLLIRRNYKRLEPPVQCKLTYKKFKPVMYKKVDGLEYEVQITKDNDGNYYEVLDVDTDEGEPTASDAE